MNKIIEFLKQSNRYKHLIGGLLVGILAFTRGQRSMLQLSQPPVWN